MSDLRDRILALNGEAGSRREALEMAAQLADAESAAVREEVDFQRNIVRGLYGQIDEGNKRTARWISKAINAENALNEANKLLEQTIEVLEEVVDEDCGLRVVPEIRRLLRTIHDHRGGAGT